MVAPPALSDHAETGVPALVALQQDFPKAARAALATAQTVPDDASTGQKFTAFLKRQTNARSLSPRDGDDADAVLSRAEASLAEGDLKGALGEISALPEPAREAMQTWLNDAQRRDAALAAVNALTVVKN